MRLPAKYVVAIGLMISLVLDAAKAESPLVGRCFWIHGRLEQSNGTPSLRIWKVGTKRLLGVFDCAYRDESEKALPANVKAVAGRFAGVPTLGNYKVCPLTKPEQGRMQMVCIKKAVHLASMGKLRH